MAENWQRLSTFGQLELGERMASCAMMDVRRSNTTVGLGGIPWLNSTHSYGGWTPAAMSARPQPEAARRPASSSANTSDDDDDALCIDDDSLSAISNKDRRREAHTIAEQKRRDSIKRGYDELQRIVPTCHHSEPVEHRPQPHEQTTCPEYSSSSSAGSASRTKLSKAVILQRSIDYIQHHVQHRRRLSDELESLRKEVLALRIMKTNYEDMVKSHHHSTPAFFSSSTLPEDAKMALYRELIDRLFASFNSTVCVSNFAELSACVFYWLEEYCKPRLLRELMTGALQRVADEHREHRERRRPY